MPFFPNRLPPIIFTADKNDLLFKIYRCLSHCGGVWELNVVKKKNWGILLLGRDLVGLVLMDVPPDGDVKTTGTNLLSKE